MYIIHIRIICAGAANSAVETRKLLFCLDCMDRFKRRLRRTSVARTLCPLITTFSSLYGPRGTRRDRVRRL